MARKSDEADPFYADIELEQQVLRHMAVNDHSLTLHVREDVFQCRTHQTIFRSLKELNAVFPAKALPAAIMRRAVGRDADDPYSTLADDIQEILRAPALNSGAAWESLTALKEVYTQGHLVESAKQAQELAEEGKLQESIETIQKAFLYDQTRIDSGDYIDDYAVRLKKMQERTKAAKKGESDLIPTGITALDKITGGIMRGELGIVIGASGKGKSVSQLNFAVFAWLAGFNVVHLGLEMGREENEYRADTLFTAIPAKVFRLAKLKGYDFKRWAATISHLKKTRKNYLEFAGLRKPSLQEIRGYVESTAARRGRVDLVILDHIGLVRPAGYWVGKKHEDLTVIAEDAKDWAGERRFGLWTAGQLDAEGQKAQKKSGGITAAHVKYAKGIAETAQLVIALHQPAALEISREAVLHLVKGRGVKDGDQIRILPDFDRMILDRQSYYNSTIAELHRATGKEKAETSL